MNNKNQLLEEHNHLDVLASAPSIASLPLVIEANNVDVCRTVLTKTASAKELMQRKEGSKEHGIWAHGH